MVNMYYDKLNESDLHIWNYIDNHRRECASLTIEDLGRRCNVSRSTILRFSQKIGLDGFQELKYYLKNEINVNTTKYKQIDISTLFDNYSGMISDLQNRNYMACNKMIREANRIFVASSGAIQRSVAQELARQFLRVGIVMTLINGDSEIKLLAKYAQKDDLIIMVSMTGENARLIALAKMAKSVGVKTISITRLRSNSLSMLVNEPIYVFLGDFPIVMDLPYTSPVMFFAITELLFTNYYNYLIDLKSTDLDI